LFLPRSTFGRTDALESVATPWIWESMNDEDRTARGTVEMCEVDYSQKVRSQPQAEVKAQVEPRMRDYAVSFPVSE